MEHGSSLEQGDFIPDIERWIFNFAYFWHYVREGNQGEHYIA